MIFFNNYLYLTTLLIAIVCSIFLISKKEIFIQKVETININKIYLYLGLIALVLQVIFISDLIYSWRWNSLLHGDLCTFSFLFAVPIFLSRNKKLIRSISPWLLIGSILTFAVGTLQFKQHFYLGETTSYLKHVTMFALGVFGIFPFTKYTKKEMINVIYFGLFFLTYLVLVPSMVYWTTKDEYWGVYSAGFLKPTYYEYEFSTRFGSIKAGDFTILDIPWLPYPIPTIIFYFVVITLMYLLVNIYTTDWANAKTKLLLKISKK